jgi:hypothetical protein
MNKLQEDKVVPVIIDLTASGDQINESFLRSFGAAIELVIKRMFGLNHIDFQVRGPKNAVQKLSKTLRKETEYMEAFNRLGLNNKSVLDNKWKLQRAIKDFESETGIKWPLK